jgi:putative ABC transport system permease protein
METFWSDLRYGVRRLAARPFFTALAILTLALGIGANTAIFSVINTVLFAPLGFTAPEELYALSAAQVRINLRSQPVSWPDFNDWRTESHSFSAMAAMRTATLNLVDGADPDRVDALRISPEILKLLGLTPSIGRDFSPTDGNADAAPVALISDGLWQRRYGASPSVIGRVISLDGRRYTIIGVLPPGLRHPGLRHPESGTDIWIPLIPQPSEMARSFRGLRIIARLAPGVTHAQAAAEMQAICEAIERENPRFNTGYRAEVIPLTEQIVGRLRRTLWILWGAVGGVLLIACANVASLLLAQGSARSLELAIRTAFGASRWRLVRQMMTECMVLGVIGGGAGLLLAWWGAPLLASADASRLPRIEAWRIDYRVLVFTVIASLGTGLLCGLLPALRFSGRGFNVALREGRRDGGGVNQRGSHRLLDLLVGIEIALALILLLSAGLMLRSLSRLRSVPLGFEPHQTIVLGLNLPATKYRDQTAQLNFFRDLTAQVATIPGLQSVGAISRLPLVGSSTLNFTIEGKPVATGDEPSADYRTVSVNGFQALGVKILAGRDFSERDAVDAPDAIVINETLRRRFFADENPLGRRIQLAAERTRWREVVGIVSDVKLVSIDAETSPAIYVPFAQNTWPNALRGGSLIARVSGDAATIVPALRARLGELDREMPFVQTQTMDDLVARSLAQRQFNTRLLAIFAGLAAVLAVVGIYGVMSFRVSQRTHELGVRLALGAGSADLIRLVLGHGARITAIGIAVGLAGATALTRLLGSLLYEVSATDPVTFAGAALVLGATALLACYLPARRAGRVDPVIAMRGN